METNLGDVATWIGSIGTILAVGWAVYLYRRSIGDREMEQARLLSPLGPLTVNNRPAQPYQHRRILVTEGVVTDRDAHGNDNVVPGTQAVDLRLHSESPESFTDLHVWLVPRSGGDQVAVPIDCSVMAPKEVLSWFVYFPEDTLPEGPIDIRVWFTDSAGKRWERITGKPLRQRKKNEILRPPATS